MEITRAVLDISKNYRIGIVPDGPGKWIWR